MSVTPESVPTISLDIAPSGYVSSYGSQNLSNSTPPTVASFMLNSSSVSVARYVDSLSPAVGPPFRSNNTGEDFLAFPDTSQFPYPSVIVYPPLWEVVVKVVFYAVIIVLALIGNILVVYIVWHNKRMRTTTNFFIVNLAISDLMVTTSCTWVHLVDNLTEGWVLGAFFCKFNSFAQGKYI